MAAPLFSVDLGAKVYSTRAADSSSIPSLSVGDFSGSGHTGDLKIGTPVATLPGVWHHRVSVGTGCPGSRIP